MSLYLGDTLISGAEQFVGESRNIGQIIPSTIPLADAGLHLLDGSLILGSGIYNAFVTYIAGLVTDYHNLFCTEADWQTSVTNYGACDKYVYDSVNNTVRLPKRSTTHGKLISSYNGGTIWYRVYEDGWCEQGGGLTTTGTVTFLKPFINTNITLTMTRNSAYQGAISAGFHGSWTSAPTTTGFTCFYDSNTAYSWSASGYIDISDYQYSPIYEYIVLATSTKTEIEVDIDEIATDLNGKADTDLMNVPNSKAILTESYVNGTSWYRIYSDGWCEQGGTLTPTNNFSYVLNFLVSFKDTNYYIGKSYGGTYTGNCLCSYISFSSKTTSSVVTFNGGTGDAYMWHACGYIN